MRDVLSFLALFLKNRILRTSLIVLVCCLVALRVYFSLASSIGLDEFEAKVYSTVGKSVSETVDIMGPPKLTVAGNYERTPRDDAEASDRSDSNEALFDLMLEYHYPGAQAWIYVWEDRVSDVYVERT